MPLEGLAEARKVHRQLYLRHRAPVGLLGRLIGHPPIALSLILAGLHHAAAAEEGDKPADPNLRPLLHQVFHFARLGYALIQRNPGGRLGL